MSDFVHPGVFLKTVFLILYAPERGGGVVVVVGGGGWKRFTVLDKQVDAKKATHYRRVLLVTELFNIAANDPVQRNLFVVSGRSL